MNLEHLIFSVETDVRCVFSNIKLTLKVTILKTHLILQVIKLAMCIKKTIFCSGRKRVNLSMTI